MSTLFVICTNAFMGFLLFLGGIGGMVCLGELVHVWWSRRPGSLSQYVHQRVASMLESEHWSQVVARVAAGEPDFRLDAWSGATTLGVCGLSIRWALWNGIRVTLRNPDNYWDSCEVSLTWSLSRRVQRAMCTAWPDKAPPRVIKEEKKPRRTDGSFIEMAEAERKRLGC